MTSASSTPWFSAAPKSWGHLWNAEGKANVPCLVRGNGPQAAAILVVTPRQSTGRLVPG